MSRVLLCARGAAPELAAIAGALRARQVEPLVFDTAAFPGGEPLTLAYERGGFRWSDGARVEAPAEISALWHNLVVGAALPAMASGMRETCVAAAERAVIGWLDSLGTFQLDPAWAKARADNKPYQLRVAQRVGLEIPETLISNDPAAVRDFARRVGPVITKMLVQPTGGDDLGDDEAAIVFTTALTDDDLARLDGLELCPMIFQAQIANQLDVRATVVGRRVIGAALDPAARGAGALDWRRESYALDRAPVWSAYALPPAVCDPLLQLMDHLGLEYGAADFIVRPDGGHVFLELNASGAFAFLGEPRASEIAAAIAEVLVDPAARRRARR